MKATYNPFVSGKSASGIPFVLCLAVFAILPSPLAMAADRTWNGGQVSINGNSNWTAPNNWGGYTLGVPNTPVDNDALFFGGSTTTNNNNLTVDMIFAGKTFLKR